MQLTETYNITEVKNRNRDHDYELGSGKQEKERRGEQAG